MMYPVIISWLIPENGGRKNPSQNDSYYATVGDSPDDSFPIHFILERIQSDGSWIAYAKFLNPAVAAVLDVLNVKYLWAYEGRKPVGKVKFLQKITND